jgi:signal transduction histidine kinase
VPLIDSGSSMSVRLKIALTILATGLITALAVIATVVLAFERFEHESTYQRANSFLGRVVGMYGDTMFEMHEKRPDEFRKFMQNLVLYESDTQLYLLDAQGTVLVNTGSAKLAPGFKVAIDPVRQAASPDPMPYVMGDDPERMDADAVVAARALRRAAVPTSPAAGYLYLVAHKSTLPDSRWQALRDGLARPAFGLIAAIVALTTLLAALVIASVTRPLRSLTRAVSALGEKGLQEGTAATAFALPPASRDEFGQLTLAFGAMLATLRKQWDALRRLDHFRREAVSNLSHDLRSPLTATAACLETLESRWVGDPSRAEDRALAEMALRNTRNAARLVQSMGDLAMLDEPSFRLRPERVDLNELLADIGLRFSERASRQQVTLVAPSEGMPVAAAVDVELMERAVANLLDNALKFCPPGSRVELSAQALGDEVLLAVADTGPGIADTDLPHLFDRFYQARHTVAPATGEGGKGLGLAIVKRIAELHGGDADVRSSPAGTTVTLRWPASAA